MPAGPLRFDATEVREVLRMIESESLDVRAVTMGVSLRDTASEDLERTCGAHLREADARRRERLVPTTEAVHADFAVPITSTRLSVTPLALVTEASRAPRVVPAALALDRAARELGVDYVGGFSALVEKGITPGDRALIDSIPEALATTERVCSSVNVATTRAGINIDAVLEMGRVIKASAEATAAAGGIGCARLVTFANIPDDNPFVAGALHGVGEGECVINVGCSGPGVVLSALKRLRASGEPFDVATIAETIKRMAFKVTRAGELIGREVARRARAAASASASSICRWRPRRRSAIPWRRSWRRWGSRRRARPASVAALALLTDAVKKGGVMASSAVGGLSGAFIPVSEDAGMVAAARAGALSIERLESHERRLLGRAWTWWRCPATPRPRRWRRSSPTRSRSASSTTRRPASASSPCPARRRANRSIYGGLLGEAYVQPVSRFRADGFVRLGGRIPAPLQALRN